MKGNSFLFLILVTMACSKPAETTVNLDTLEIDSVKVLTDTVTINPPEIGDSTSGLLNIDGHQLEFTPIEETEYKKCFRSRDKNESNCAEFEGDCQNALENYYAKKYPNSFSRSGPTLSVGIKNGKQIDFITDTTIT